SCGVARGSRHCEETMTSAELPSWEPDVLVIGARNAALCAAISAHENGARVVMLEAAPFEERGGNSHFTGGAFRFAFAGVGDLIAVLPSETPATSLIRENGRLAGVIAEHQGAPVAIRAGAVVLACGSFESNPEMRAKYLGPGWEMARVRGTRFNMGAGLNMALDIGARPYGHWSGCHSVAWDINAPPYGDLTVGDQFQKHNYPFGILINAKGERYVDEGANFHSHTYADRKSTRLNSSHSQISYAVFCLKKKNKK